MIEKLVASLETSKALVEAGIKIDSYWSWILTDEGWKLSHYSFVDTQESYPAPLAEEILEKLPKEVNYKNESYYLVIVPYWHMEDKYKVGYRDSVGNWFDYQIKESLSEACSQMLLELKKKGLIK